MKPCPEPAVFRNQTPTHTVTSENSRFTGLKAVPLSPATGTTPTEPSRPVPDYLSDTYQWAYMDSRNARLLDREFIVRSILWWQHNKLKQAAFSEIAPGSSVLQAACVYGLFSVDLASHIGRDGHLKVVDVVDFQVDNCRRKLAPFAHTEVCLADVRTLRDTGLDAACCYFLLHEVPDTCKQEIMAVLLDAVKPGGKVVFVDYHKPHWAHPVKPVTSLIFDTLEPFAKSLWRTEIAAFARHDERFEWRKQTCFGGLFQKVVATRKAA